MARNKNIRIGLTPPERIPHYTDARNITTHTATYASTSNNTPPPPPTKISTISFAQTSLCPGTSGKNAKMHTTLPPQNYLTPPPPNTNFLYKYTIDPENPSFNHKIIKKQFNKSITGTPGSARHQGFHMAVIGRMPFEWSRYWLRLINYILIARIAPKDVLELSRIPLPKPGLGQSRPIALVHDVWAFIGAFIHDDLSEALERTKTFNDNIIAYRKGKNASDPLITIIALHEESFACGELVGFISEDEENTLTESHTPSKS